MGSRARGRRCRTLRLASDCAQELPADERAKRFDDSPVRRAPRAMGSNDGDAGTRERCVMRGPRAASHPRRMNLADGRRFTGGPYRAVAPRSRRYQGKVPAGCRIVGRRLPPTFVETSIQLRRGGPESRMISRLDSRAPEAHIWSYLSLTSWIATAAAAANVGAPLPGANHRVAR